MKIAPITPLLALLLTVPAHADAPTADVYQEAYNAMLFGNVPDMYDSEYNAPVCKDGMCRRKVLMPSIVFDDIAMGYCRELVEQGKIIKHELMACTRVEAKRFADLALKGRN
ncbi:hypothetical protein ACET9V_11095 [Aeromonas caviae]|uniref:hypothetical protein n=1 Tax=Aeromonas caviae TaxID=648 RepID=UPI0038D05ECC